MVARGVLPLSFHACHRPGEASDWPIALGPGSILGTGRKDRLQDVQRPSRNAAAEASLSATV